MENHPIPQDVTGFKFKLIGSITLKQFLYLLGAGGLCLALYFLPISAFIKFPLMGIPVVISLCLAFVPIDGRPMDKMILNFIKALPAENEYVYKKTGVDMPFFYFIAPLQHKTINTTNTPSAQKAILFNQLSRSYFKADKEEQQNLANISALFEGKTPTTGFVNRVIQADKEPEAKKPEVYVAPFETQKEIKKEEVLAKPHLPSATNIHAPVNTSSSDVQNGYQQKISTAPTNTIKPSIEAPNVIEGVVKDPRGKALPHIIVEVINSNNVPVRTFRTNQNGAFISATSIPNGKYKIHCEDTLKKQEFEDIELEATGQILPVIEVRSIDQREKLRRELFGGGI